ncbi:MAG: lactam utilization protein LamB [Flavobacteriaceae bacterium]|nr:lactam utilization protein LamB [Flavobacteriaceae bacterium]|tara:strand:- start:20236 stop:20958 length:723 start_codon:yes stop_codon:yes gene_type:complete
MRQIHLNCDMGEGLNNEHLLMPYISACNIACGAHAGSAEIIESTIDLALQHGVQIGAHPSFPDRENFGRKVLELEDDLLLKSLVDQIELVAAVAKKKKAEIYHVKAHGALYNLAAKDERTAEIVLEAVRQSVRNAIVFVPPKSKVAALAQKRNMQISYEVFCDRNYNEDYSLVSRQEPKAVLHHPEEVVAHVERLHQGTLRTLNGQLIPIDSDTFCVHGDNSKAIEILQVLNQQFQIEKL